MRIWPRKENFTLMYGIRRFGILFLLLLFLFVTLFQIPAQSQLEEQVKSQVQISLQAEAGRIADSLDRIGQNLYLYLSESAAMRYVETGQDHDQIELRKIMLVQELDQISKNENLVSALVYYAPESREQTILYSGSTNTRVQGIFEAVQEFVDVTFMREHSTWFLQEVDGAGYLFYVYKIHGSYVTVVADTDQLLRSVAQHMPMEEAVYFMEDGGGRVWEITQPLLDGPENVQPGRYIVAGHKKYLQMAEAVGNRFRIGLLIPKNQITEPLQYARIGLLLSLAAVFVIFQIVIAVMKRYITKPLEEMAEGMLAVGRGEADGLVAAPTRIAEYVMLQSSFHNMVAELKQLKIEKYEEELATQKANLQYLQLQIKPHFFLNAMNIIYSMAEVRDYGMIQKLTLKLVDYSRYMFRSATTLVFLEEEMNYVASYIEIQKVRFLDQIQYQENLEERFLRTLIPPFTIQSFVENSIKYAMKRRSQCEIMVNAQIYQERYLKLMIHDNGEGYSESYMDMVNSGLFPESRDGTHIGIYNVSQRLKLIYGSRAKIKLENKDGAVANIYIPFS